MLTDGGAAAAVALAPYAAVLTAAGAAAALALASSAAVLKDGGIATTPLSRKDAAGGTVENRHALCSLVANGIPKRDRLHKVLHFPHPDQCGTKNLVVTGCSLVALLRLSETAHASEERPQERNNESARWFGVERVEQCTITRPL